MTDDAPLYICPKCHRSLSSTDYRQHFTGDLGYTYCSFKCAYPDYQPEPDDLFDDVQALPLFSGTAPRVADPGRFDPPAKADEHQPSLF